MSCCNTHYESGEVKISEYYSDIQPSWCGGCGNFGIRAAMMRALVELEIKPWQTLLCFDIGCNGNGNDKMRGYRLHSLHGRVLPLAAAAKIANQRLKIIASAGDGATYSEGINHFVNSIRANYPMTFLVHDNGNYGLTTGQASATTPEGAPRTSNPYGPTSSVLNPLELAFALKPAFIARAFSGDIKQLVEILKQAIMFQDKGFAYVNILQACPTYNKETSHQWYIERVKKISEIDPNYDTSNFDKARELALNTDEHIATGILYQDPSSKNYLEHLQHRMGNAWEKSAIVDEVKNYDVADLLAQYQ